MPISQTTFNRSIRECPDCHKLKRVDRHRKRCFMCKTRRCIDHPDSVSRDVKTADGGDRNWGARSSKLRTNTKVFCTPRCADAYEVKVTLETTEI